MTEVYYQLKAGFAYSTIGKKKCASLREAADFGKKWMLKQRKGTVYLQRSGDLTTMWIKTENFKDMPIVTIWKYPRKDRSWVGAPMEKPREY